MYSSNAASPEKTVKTSLGPLKPNLNSKWHMKGKLTGPKAYAYLNLVMNFEAQFPISPPYS